MPSHVIVWDIETIPDLRGFAAANGHDGKTDDEIREALGNKFPKHIFHQIICIGAIVARRENSHWQVRTNKHRSRHLMTSWGWPHAPSVQQALSARSG
jgi:predicted PolB exonuclease-like 3'-5' exonuclease